VEPFGGRWGVEQTSPQGRPQAEGFFKVKPGKNISSRKTAGENRGPGHFDARSAPLGGPLSKELKSTDPNQEEPWLRGSTGTWISRKSRESASIGAQSVNRCGGGN